MIARFSAVPPCVALVSLLPAQRFSIQGVAVTPITATCSVPGQPPVTRSQPAGTQAGALDVGIPFLVSAGSAAAANVDGIFTRSDLAPELNLGSCRRRFRSEPRPCS